MRPTRVALALIPVAISLLGLATPSASAEPVVFARHLSLAPDGQTLSFTWAGDIWTVPIGGGAATRLTIHPATDNCPTWSPDGEWIAFSSNRHGTSNVFVIRRDGSDVRRLTFGSAGSEAVTSWSQDGEWVYFHSWRERDVRGESRIFRVPTAGGQSWRAMDCFGRSADLGADGNTIAFERGSATWGRRGYRGSANYDVYTWTADSGEFTRWTTFEGNDRSPVWDAEGGGVYFLSDRGGAVNVWYQVRFDADAEEVTRMADDDVRDFDVSADGETLAFTCWDKVYVMSTTDRRARVIDVTAGDDSTRNDLRLRSFTNDADQAAVSPDGKEIALVVHGEIFITQSTDDKPTRRVTDNPARDNDLCWSPDGKALFFASDRAGQEDVYRAMSAEEPTQPLCDSLRFKIERVTDDPAIEHDVVISPDGEKLSFVRGLGDLIIRDLESGDETVLLESWNAPGYSWSPNSEWIAYRIEDLEHNPDIWIVPADGSADPVNISQHPDFDGGPQWSADGQMLAFASSRHGFDSDLYVVFLSPELDELSGVERDEYFEQAAEAVKKLKPLESAAASGEIALAGHIPETQPAETQPAESQPADTQPADTQPAESQPAETQPAVVEPEDELQAQVVGWIKEYLAKDDDSSKKKKEKKPKKEDDEEAEEQPEYEYELETCYRRIRRVTSLEGDQMRFALAPDGKTLVFTSSHEGDAKVYKIKWNGKERKRILSSSAGGLHWGLKGKKLYYIKKGVPHSCSPSGSGNESHGFRAKIAIDHSAEAAQKFNDAARQLGLRFYHPTMKGLDWPALTSKYRDLALRTPTVGEFNAIFNLLLGELNASHMGIYGPSSGITRESVGYLGCTFDRTFAGPGLKVASVLPRTPADKAASRLVPGDILLTVAGYPVGPDSSIEQALVNATGDEIIVEYEPSPDRVPEEAEEAEEVEEAEEGEEVEEAEEAEEVVEADDEAAEEPATESPSEEADESQTKELVIRPASSGTIGNRKYAAWVVDNARYVDEHSEGRVGYLHIHGMGQREFEVFERDLYAAAHGRDGLIIDVRDNGGGWTADWVLAVLSVKRHAYTIARGGAVGYPQDRLIFYAWTKPATMMCNRNSFSNAEIVAHAFKNLGRGPLVGMPTHGGVISTGGYGLIDGAHVRMPMRGWYTLPAGLDMENNGAQPDVQVPVTPEDEVAERRPQLDAAIEATLEQLGTSETPPLH